MTFDGERPPQSSVNMQGFYSKLDDSSSPLLGVGREGSRIPLSLAVEAEKAQALLQTFSSASLLASAGLGAFCVVADHALQVPAIQNHLWLRAALDNATHGLVGLWSWAVVIGLRKKSDVYEVLLAGLLASLIDLDHFYMAGSLSLKVRPPHTHTVQKYLTNLHCVQQTSQLTSRSKTFCWTESVQVVTQKSK